MTVLLWLGVGLLVIPVAATLLGFCIAHLVDMCCCDVSRRWCVCECCIQDYEYI